jgi:catechol 2,3-dioxygenase-like lactoylglutathione lyase family enzyme
VDGEATVTGFVAAGAGIPTIRGVEHLSLTVADLDEASAFFEGFFGCQPLYTMGPFEDKKSPFMRVFGNADVRAIVHRLRVLRSPFLNIELFEATYPGQRARWPDMLDIGGWHLAGYVDDMDAAIEYMGERDVYVLGTGKKPTTGPEAGDGSFACHCMTNWGFHFELLTYPNGRAYRADFADRLWNPAQPDRGAGVGATSRPGAVPGFRGFEHVSITVADLDEACELLEGLLGCAPFYDLGPPLDRRGSTLGAYANVDVRAAPSRVRLLRSPYLNIEVVECPPYPGQNRVWPGMLDCGGWHLAFYVDDVEAALDHLARADEVRVLGGKKPAVQCEAGDGAFTVHCLASFGLYFELVTYPHGRLAEAQLARRAWHPGRPDA